MDAQDYSGGPDSLRNLARSFRNVSEALLVGGAVGDFGSHPGIFHVAKASRKWACAFFGRRRCGVGLDRVPAD